MSTLIQINVTNNSQSARNFFFFQQPSIYVGGQAVFSNSLLSTTILPASQGGSVYTFLLDLQYYAGVQERFTPPVIGQPSGYSSAIRAIDLTPTQGGSPKNNCTTMINSPALGLVPPVSDTSVQSGAFRIISPTFNPTIHQYNGGSAVQLPNGAVVLSNFVSVDPTSNLDCQPILKFYVQTGNYTAGTVMNFTSSSIGAAICDATNGFTTFNVSYNPDGTWSVTPSVRKLSINANSDSCFSMENQNLNTDIYNEAGTQIISRGYASSMHSPIHITNLTNPSAIYTHGAYQLSINDSPRIGVDCVEKNGNSATFVI
ncbi:MAG: hypothetical protein RSC05_13250 [Acinetobacter sp.]